MSSPLILPKKGLRREFYEKRSGFFLTPHEAKLEEKKEKKTSHTVFQDFDQLPNIRLKNTFKK